MKFLLAAAIRGCARAPARRKLNENVKRESIMTLMRSLLWRAARRIAADPRVRTEAQAVYRREVEPRIKTAWAEARPRIDRARAEVAEAAREADPRQDARAFLRNVKERFRRRRDG